MGQEHERLWSICKTLPTDYDPWGEVKRWEDPNAIYPDCSGGCKWARWLEDIKDNPISMDWCVCTNPQSPRCGMLTFEHQGCLLGEEDEDNDG